MSLLSNVFELLSWKQMEISLVKNILITNKKLLVMSLLSKVLKYWVKRSINRSIIKNNYSNY